MKGLFITGSDTNVGKTYISCQIAGALRSRNINVIPRKPVETGCALINGELYPEDASSLLAASQANISLDTVNPYRFSPAISPQIAARLAGTELSLDQLLDSCTIGLKPDDFLLVEGAGGFLSPICEQQLNADLAKALGLPVLLVVSDRLGSVNQALLTSRAIQLYQLELRAIALNQCSVHQPHASINNAAEIKQFSDYPVIEIAYNESMTGEHAQLFMPQV